MGLSTMYDASTPPSSPPAVPVVAFYIGGDTPHVWTDAEIAASPATYGLPIYVHDAVTGDAAAAADQVISWLEAHQWEHGTAVAIDTEAVVELTWIEEFDSHVHAAGWLVLDYESKGPAPSNPLTSGGRWIANWTNVAELYPGSVATQYASAGMLGTSYDLSVIDQAVKLHQLHAAPPPPPAPLVADVHLDYLRDGSQGPQVRNLQVLLIGHAMATQAEMITDGIFGPITLGGVKRFQQWAQIADDGVVGPITWTALLTR